MRVDGPHRQADSTNAVMLPEAEVPDPVPDRRASQQPAVVDFPDYAGRNALERMFQIDPEYQYAWPEAKNLPFVFPHYMCTAIFKTRDRASIMLSFPLNPAQCCLSFYISANEVQHIAKELFEVHFRVEEERRSVIFGNGATVEINSSIILRGAKNAVIDALFGPTVGEAFRHSLPRMTEVSMGEILSKSLSMEVWDRFDHPCWLTVMVDASWLSTIYTSLWKSS